MSAIPANRMESLCVPYPEPLPVAGGFGTFGSAVPRAVLGTATGVPAGGGCVAMTTGAVSLVATAVGVGGAGVSVATGVEGVETAVAVLAGGD